MRRALAAAVVVLTGSALLDLAAAGAAGPSPHVTYVANEGFLVSVGDVGVLVDGLFGPRPLSFADVPGTEGLAKLALQGRQVGPRAVVPRIHGSSRRHVGTVGRPFESRVPGRGSKSLIAVPRGRRGGLTGDLASLMHIVRARLGLRP